MNRGPGLRLVSTEEPKTESGGQAAEGRSPLALSRLDWLALWLLAAALVIAPLGAGTFATPQRIDFQPPEGWLLWLQTAAVPLVLALTAAAFGIVAWREWKRPVAIGAV